MGQRTLLHWDCPIKSESGEMWLIVFLGNEDKRKRNYSPFHALKYVINKASCRAQCNKIWIWKWALQLKTSYARARACTHTHTHTGGTLLSATRCSLTTICLKQKPQTVNSITLCCSHLNPCESALGISKKTFEKCSQKSKMFTLLDPRVLGQWQNMGGWLWVTSQESRGWPQKRFAY